MATPNKKKLLIVLPSIDFDVTETSVPWKLLSKGGVQVDFTNEDGKAGEYDPLLLSGVLFGQLGAAPEPKQFYEQMAKSPEFQNPQKYSQVDFKYEI